METTMSEIPTRQKGDSLELAIEHIFNVAGFKTKRNIFIAKYEIDVKVEVGDRTIIVECKNYQNSSLAIRNLIHQWNSKNQIINAQKIIIALAGVTIKESDYSLASEFDIELWSQEDISELFNLSLKPYELKQRILQKISFKPITISERYRTEITYLVIKPLLSNHFVEKEKLFSLFNRWLRAFILTELQMFETNAEERAGYIELFEGTKTKKGFLNLVSKKRKEVEYWQAVKEQLEFYDILPRNTQDKYLGYMNDLIREYNEQQSFFSSENYLTQIKKLILSRLHNAYVKGQKCSFKNANMKNRVLVDFSEEEEFGVQVAEIKAFEANVLNWIMTSQCTWEINQQTQLYTCRWACSSLDDLTEKVYRIFTEYYEVGTKDKLVDTNIK